MMKYTGYGNCLGLLMMTDDDGDDDDVLCSWAHGEIHGLWELLGFAGTTGLAQDEGGVQQGGLLQ